MLDPCNYECYIPCYCNSVLKSILDPYSDPYSDALYFMAIYLYLTIFDIAKT